MEKKIRENKIPTAWDTKTEEYWTVKSKSGWNVEYLTEEQAAKAEDFLANLNWKSTPFIENTWFGYTFNLITGHLKYPLKEVKGRYGSGPMEFLDDELKDVVGDFKALELVDNNRDHSYDALIVLNEDNQKQLIEFLNK